MISSPSAQIVNAISESHFLTAKSGDRVEAYGPTMGIATVIIALGIAVSVMFGPEHKVSMFSESVFKTETETDWDHRARDSNWRSRPVCRKRRSDTSWAVMRVWRGARLRRMCRRSLRRLRRGRGMRRPECLRLCAAWYRSEDLGGLMEGRPLLGTYVVMEGLLRNVVSDEHEDSNQEADPE